MDQLGDLMTSRQLSGWEAYFTALHELGDEAVARMTGQPAGAMSAPPGERLMNEAEMDAFFLGHVRRARAEAA